MVCHIRKINSGKGPAIPVAVLTGKILMHCGNACLYYRHHRQ